MKHDASLRCQIIAEHKALLGYSECVTSKPDMLCVCTCVNWNLCNFRLYKVMQSPWLLTSAMVLLPQSKLKGLGTAVRQLGEREEQTYACCMMRRAQLRRPLWVGGISYKFVNDSCGQFR